MKNYIVLWLIVFILLFLLFIIYTKKNIEGLNRLQKFKQNVSNVAKKTSSALKLQSVANIGQSALNAVVNYVKKPTWPPPPPRILGTKTICKQREKNDGEESWCKNKARDKENMQNNINALNSEIYQLEELQKQQNEHIKVIEDNILNIITNSNIISNKIPDIVSKIDEAIILEKTLYQHKDYTIDQLKKKSKESAFKDISIINIYG